MFGGICDPHMSPCVGGFARLATAVREAFAREPDSVLLNGGDSFQGTIWYNLLRWNVTQEFMNMLPHDAHVLGNHEFDNGVEGVVPYLAHLTSPVLAANIMDDDEPGMHGLYHNSVVVERGGQRIGIIGVIIASTHELASTGKLQFTDEVDAVRREAQLLHDDGVKVIIALTHCGLEIDREIALHGGPYVDIIVGGHSHSLLFNGEPPNNSSFSPVDSYPVEVTQHDGQKVLIVQAAAHAMYLGEIKLLFDSDGQLLKWSGKPHYLGNEIEQAPDVMEKIRQYLPMVQELGNVEVGSSLVHMSSECACQECNLGSFVCEAFMHKTLELAVSGNWIGAHFCIINQGSIRSDIPPGVITFAALILSTPFDNAVEVFDLRGDHIMEMFEYAVMNVPFPGARMLQVSGIQVSFDGSKPRGRRVTSVAVRCIECDVPTYEPLRLDQYYKVVAQSFIGTGGDGFTMIAENRKNVQLLGIDNVILREFIELQSPTFRDVDGRITLSSPCAD